MLALWLFVALVVCLLFGWVGTAIAVNKGVSSGAGFWLGFFLGPIGLVIAALLSPPAEPPPSQPSIPQKFDGEPDLKNDAYKLWLTSRYDIKKNDVLGSYVCQERLFPTVDEALGFASEQHQVETAAAAAEESRRAEELAKWREKCLKQQQESDEKWKRVQPYVVFVGTLVVIWFCYLVYFGVQNEAEQTRIQQEQAAEAKRKHDALLAPINAMFASEGVSLGDNANDPVKDTDQNFCTFTTAGEQSKKIVGKAASFVTATYPPNKTVGDVRLNPSTEWLREDLDTGLSSDDEWLFSSRRSGTFVFITAHDETDYKAPTSDLTFRTKVHLCVGKPVNVGTDSAMNTNATDINTEPDLTPTTNSVTTDDESETTTDINGSDVSDATE